MTTLASSTEEILEKLMRLAYGDLTLLQTALDETAKAVGGIPQRRREAKSHSRDSKATV